MYQISDTWKTFTLINLVQKRYESKSDIIWLSCTEFLEVNSGNTLLPTYLTELNDQRIILLHKKELSKKILINCNEKLV